MSPVLLALGALSPTNTIQGPRCRTRAAGAHARSEKPASSAAIPPCSVARGLARAVLGGLRHAATVWTRPSRRRRAEVAHPVTQRLSRQQTEPSRTGSHASDTRAKTCSRRWRSRGTRARRRIWLTCGSRSTARWRRPALRCPPSFRQRCCRLLCPLAPKQRGSRRALVEEFRTAAVQLGPLAHRALPLPC